MYVPHFMHASSKSAEAIPTAIIGFVDACLRGLGQIVFANSPASGLLLLAGMLAASRWLGVCAIAGVVSATATAYGLRLDSGRTRSGLHGYNGALVGAAFATLLTPAWSPGVLFAIVGAAAASTIVMTATATVVMGLAGLPPLTLPFNFVTLPCLLFAAGTSRIGHVPSLGVPATPLNASAAAVMLSPQDFVQSAFRGVGQIVLADSALAGALILTGITLVSRRAAAFAFVGSALGTFLGVLLGADRTAVEHGLWGYNAFVTAQALGGVFLAFSLRSAIFALGAAVTATVLHGALGVAFGPLGAPGLTLAFCLATFAFLLTTRATPLLESVYVSDVSHDED